jgi:GTP-binding nuclear protein Ran
MTTQFKVVLIGNGATGKTSWIKRLFLNYFETRYNPTLGVEVHSYEVHSYEVPHRNVVFNMWDCAGQERFGGLRDGYYICANAAIIFHEIGGPDQWQRDFQRVCDKDEPIVHVFSKSELLTQEQKNDILKMYPNAIFISAKNNENILEPIFELLRKL